MDNRSLSAFESLPEEILLPIIISIAENSCVDIIRLMGTSSFFRRICRDERVLKRMYLAPLVPIPEGGERLYMHEDLVHRCMVSGNIEATFMYAFTGLVEGNNDEWILDRFRLCADEWFTPAVYVFGLLCMCLNEPGGYLRGLGYLDTLYLEPGPDRRLYVSSLRQYLDGFFRKGSSDIAFRKKSPTRWVCDTSTCEGRLIWEGRVCEIPEIHYDDLCNACFWDREAERFSSRFRFNEWL